LLEVKIGHARARSEFVWVLDPAVHPAGIDLGTDLAQARRDFRDIFISLDEVAAGATDLLEQTLAIRKQRRLFKFLHIEMARGAARLDLSSAQQRVFLVMHFAVGLLDAIHSDTLSVVARCTTEFFRRMGVIREQHLALRMCFERIGLFLKAGPVDRQMAGLAAIHARNRLIKPIAVVLF
jgi:hypothetical protein